MRISRSLRCCEIEPHRLWRWQRRFYASKFRSITPSRELWGSLRRLGFLSDSNEMAPPFTADELNKHFVRRATYSDFPRLINVSSNPVLPLPRLPRLPNGSFSFHNVMSAEVVKAVNSIRSNSVGLDSIPISFIKLLLPFILPIVMHIFKYK